MNTFESVLQAAEARLKEIVSCLPGDVADSMEFKAGRLVAITDIMMHLAKEVGTITGDEEEPPSQL